MSDIWQLYMPEILKYGTFMLLVFGGYVLLVVLVIYGLVRSVRKMMDPVDDHGNRISWPRCPLCQRKDKVKIDLPATGTFNCKRCGHSFTQKATR